MAVTSGPYAPPGPPLGPPPAPPRPVPWWKSRAFRLAVSALLLVTAAVVLFISRSDKASAGEVFLLPKDAPGPNPFTPSFASAAADDGPNALAATQPGAEAL